MRSLTAFLLCYNTSMKRLSIILSTIALLCSCADNRDYAVIYQEKCDKFANQNANDFNCDIDFVGDSITEGYNVKRYYKNYKVANRGISGDTTDMLLTRMEVSAYNLEPKVISLMIGTNNLDTCMNNYEAILQGFYEHLPNTKVVVVSILPRRGEDLCKKIKNNNAQIEQLANKYSYTYVNLYSAFIKDEYQVNESLFKDGLHPNLRGYRLLTDNLNPVFSNLLN